MEEERAPEGGPAPPRHQRRKRYSGKYPRAFEDKYKERSPELYPDTVSKVLSSGKTPAGTHRPIMVRQVLQILDPRPGQVAVDCTLGFGGHAEEILARIQPGGRLLGLDADPVELPKVETRLRSLGFGAESFTAARTNFAGLPQALAAAELEGADIILADLGVSSMQLDDPTRGFSTKFAGPLDMRMNPGRGASAATLLQRLDSHALTEILREHADEPYAEVLGPALARKSYATTTELSVAIRDALARKHKDEQDLAVRRVFQALRIAVNDEFSALESLLRHLPACLKPGGKVAILTFHSGEDRRVKKSFEAGLRSGAYAEIASEIMRPDAEEQHANPRSRSAKLRWARKTG